jgi:hypothetical protein
MGGEGTITYFPEGGSVVISQTKDILQRVEVLLEALRKAKAAQPKREEPGMV